MTKRAIGACLFPTLLLCLCMCGSGGSGSSSTVAQTSGTGDSSSPASPDGSSGNNTGSAPAGGSSTGSTPASGGGSTPAPGFPSSDHVFVILLENQSFSQVFPSGAATNCASSGMPYLCSLAAANGLAVNFYSNLHGSLRAYLYSTSGSAWTGKPYDCSGSSCASAGVITGDNLVRALTAAGKTWRGYFEDMPSQGYMGAQSGHYTEHHNPFKWYSDVAGSLTQQDNMYPFTQFAQDVQGGAFQNFSYIIPSTLHDAEGDGGQSSSALLATADAWLKTNISPLLSTAPFLPGGDGILMIAFDEGKVSGKSGDSSNDNSCSPTQASGCGGHVVFVMIGPNVISGSVTAHTYHFQDMFHTTIHLLGLSDYMNNANGAADIALLPGVGK